MPRAHAHTGSVRQMLTVTFLGFASIITAFSPITSAADTAPANAAQTADANKAQNKRVGWIEITGPIEDRPDPNAWMREEKNPSMRTIVQQVLTVANNDNYAGLVISLDQTELSTAQVQEIADAIAAARAKGKHVMVYSESYDLRSYLLACAADEILLLNKGSLELAGLGMEEMYYAGLLEKIGVKADFVQVGKFKGAADPFIGTQPSPEWDQNINALLDDIYDQALSRIANARKMSREQVEAAMKDSWTLDDKGYVARGLVDKLVDRDLTQATGDAFGEDFDWDTTMGVTQAPMKMDNPFFIFQMLLKGAKQEVRRNSIAVIHADGEIHSGDSSFAGPVPVAPRAGLFGGASIGSRTITETLADVRDNELVKGVILRIDSPGGSALASEVMWQAIRDCAKEKPVYISVSSLAASGGYYMACAGDKIYVEPTSIVGSIGVVSGKMVLGGLYEKIGLSITTRARGPMADIYSSVTPFSEEQRAAMLAAASRIYDQFLDRVTKGRDKKIANLDNVAQGRVFTGRQAVLNGLADQIGGLDQAVKDMAEKVGLAEGAYDIVDLPEPPSFAEILDSMIGLQAGPGLDQLATARTAQSLLGPEAWQQVRTGLAGLMLLKKEPVLTLMPYALRVK
ncbi:MAG: signal peptide peptidase SppA [Phycisphaera sp.]|nr:signal peptide peptidase SppA [Phycisphaera sp.]